MRRNIYICSKPLQYFNLRNIDCRDKDVRLILIIHGRFLESEKFYSKVKEQEDAWDEILFVNSWFQLYWYLFFHPAHTLFVEVDKSFVSGIFHWLHRFKKMYVFEEGFGSYRRDRFDDSTGLKRMINRLSGVGEHVGFSRFLNGQYLYLPELYKQLFPGYTKQILPFRKPFLEALKEELPFFLSLSNGYEEFLTIREKRVGLGLTTHQANPGALQYIGERKNEFDLLYLKPHPHMERFSEIEQYNLRIIRSNIMVEFILLILLENRNEVTVFHENSTSVIWFQNRLNCVNLGNTYQEYENVISYIKENRL